MFKKLFLIVMNFFLRRVMIIKITWYFFSSIKFIK